MLASQMIKRLQELQFVFGDVEVEITDGHQLMSWAGDFVIDAYSDDNGLIIDIGVGGLLQE